MFALTAAWIHYYAHLQNIKTIISKRSTVHCIHHTSFHFTKWITPTPSLYTTLLVSYFCRTSFAPVQRSNHGFLEKVPISTGQAYWNKIWFIMFRADSLVAVTESGHCWVISNQYTLLHSEDKAVQIGKTIWSTILWFSQKKRKIGDVIHSI